MGGATDGARNDRQDGFRSNVSVCGPTDGDEDGGLRGTRHPGSNTMSTTLICGTVIYDRVRWLTFCDVDSVGALGDLLASKQHTDGVGPLHHGPVGTTENTVPFVLQDELYCVLFTLRVDDDHADITIAST